MPLRLVSRALLGEKRTSYYALVVAPLEDLGQGYLLLHLSVCFVNVYLHDHAPCFEAVDMYVSLTSVAFLDGLTDFLTLNSLFAGPGTDPSRSAKSPFILPKCMSPPLDVMEAASC